MVTAAAVLGSTLQVGAARGQCDSAASLEAYNGLAGVDVEVRAMVAWDPDGTAGPAPNLMVLGGQFERAGNLTGVHGLVGWNGANFVPITPGVIYTDFLASWAPFGPANATRWLVQISTGPDPVFTTYNGSTWGNTTTFTGGAVKAMTTWDPAGPNGPHWVVVAGDNLRVGAVGPCNLLRFDGSTWANIGSVSAPSFPGINALETWDPDGSGPTFNDCLAIGGRFDHFAINGAAGNPTVGNVTFLQYNPAVQGGFAQSTMMGGVAGDTSVIPTVNTLKAWDAGGAAKRLVIGGSFLSAGGSGNARGLVWYSVTNLSTGAYFAVDGGTNQWVPSRLTVWNPAGSTGTARLVEYGHSPNSQNGMYQIDTAGNASAIGQFVDWGTEAIKAIGVWDVAGDGLQPQWLFAGGQTAFHSIARINTGNWIGLPNLGADGTVLSSVSVSNFATTNPSGTFVAGQIDYAGNVPVANVANWGGSSWGSVGNGLNGTVRTLGTFTSGIGVNRATTIYAGGDFTASGATAMHGIAHLTGGPLGGYTWSALGSGVGGSVYSVLQFDPDGSGPIATSVVVAGTFTTAGGATANRIAYWTPSTSTWGTFGSGFNGNVNAAVAWDPDGSGPLPARLLAGGNFTTASGIAISHLAWWDGVQWQPFEGGGINGNVTSLMVWPDPSNAAQPRLVIGGTFSQAGSTAANSLAVWRPSGWDTAMGAGVTSTGVNVNVVASITAADLDGPSSPVATQGTELVIAGAFDHNGQGDVVSGLARWDPSAQRWVSMGSWAGAAFVRPWSAQADGRPTLLVGGHFTRPEFTAPAGLAVWSGGYPYVASAPTTQQQDCDFSTVTLSTNVLGDNLVYRWQRNGVNLNNGATASGSTISGVTTATLTINNAEPTDSGNYSLSIFSPCGNTSTLPTTLTVQRCCGSADFNCDGDAATDADIEAFFRCVAGTCPVAPCTSSADFDDDGDAGTDADIEAFFRVIAGGSC